MNQIHQIMPPSDPTPDITLYFLQASRSIRIAWLLEALSLPYKTIFFPRINNKAPADFRERSGNSLGKAPVLRDGELVLAESGAITEYVHPSIPSFFSRILVFLCGRGVSAVLRVDF